MQNQPATVTFYTAPCISAHHPNGPVFAEVSGRWFSCNGSAIRKIQSAPNGAAAITLNGISRALWADKLAESVRKAA